MANTNLSNAKAAKNDEFYTQYPDIQKEINAYLDYNPNVFRGKTVLLPCDDPEWSNFTRFFAQNFEQLGLKKLISTSFAYDSKKVKGPIQLTLFETEAPKLCLFCFDMVNEVCRYRKPNLLILDTPLFPDIIYAVMSSEAHAQGKLMYPPFSRSLLVLNNLSPMNDFLLYRQACQIIENVDSSVGQPCKISTNSDFSSIIPVRT